MAVEEPPFTLVEKSGSFEVRDYPGLVVAEVHVGGSRAGASNAGFRLLAGYIFGGNTRQEKVAMRAPVTQAPLGSEKIAMTAPVTVSGEPGQWAVQFTMPKSYTLDTLPRPKDDRVKLKALPPVRLAVLRFSGLTGDAEVKKRTAALTASLARYNPPWTPWFMRRNEVMIPVEAAVPN